MLIVPIDDVQEGMVLAADVMHPSQPEQVLLKRGFRLDELVVKRMREMGVAGVYVDYPGLGELDRHLMPVLSPQRQKIYGQVKATIAALEKTARPTVGFSDYYCAMREFVITLMQQGEHPVYLEQMALRMGERAVAHATAVAHLSLLLGIKLHTYLRNQRRRLRASHATEVVNLGIAGMLHDIGKCKLAGPLRHYSVVNGPRDVEDRAAWEEHSRIGHQMIRGGVESSAAAAVLHHHQRFDGTGFPTTMGRDGKARKMEGDRIHVFARILAAADLFDRLTHREVGGEASWRPAHEVLRRMEREYVGWIDPMVWEAMGQVVPPYALGSKVRLTDGTEAVVVGLGVKDAWRPKVRRVKGVGWELEEGVVDLGMEGGVSIVDDLAGFGETKDESIAVFSGKLLPNPTTQ